MLNPKGLLSISMNNWFSLLHTLSSNLDWYLYDPLKWISATHAQKKAKCPTCEEKTGRSEVKKYDVSIMEKGKTTFEWLRMVYRLHILCVAYPCGDSRQPKTGVKYGNIQYNFPHNQALTS